MTLAEFLERLQQDNIHLSESKLRWAIRAGRVSKPKLDGSGRYKFTEKHVTQIIDYLVTKRC